MKTIPCGFFNALQAERVLGSLNPEVFRACFLPHFWPDSPVSAMFCNANLRSDGQPVGELSMGQQPVESSSSLPVFFSKENF